MLAERGHVALSYHAGMDQLARDDHQNTFMTEAGVIVVATIAFGMGIDKSDVRYVFHTDLPASVEAYYQEIGRAGRDGEPAIAHMLYGLDDIRMRRVFIEQEDAESDRKRREHKRLDALIGICESPECRRRALLAYFGEAIEPCGNCDICRDPIEMTDGSDIGRMVLSAVQRTGQRFGTSHIIDVLRGADTEKIRQLGHNNLPIYGSGAATKKPEWQSLIRQLVASGFLHLDIQGYGGISVTARGEQLQNGNTDFFYRRDLVSRDSGAKAVSKRSRRSAGSLPSYDPGDFTAPQAKTYARLKELRMALARKRGVPAYVIFSDRSLNDMVTRNPQTTEEFSQVHGVGKAKLKDFAELFLGALQEKELA
jgi:ATP-dependent DNA helicase RecQ